jgi:trans-aconitate 2-methyltransferase
MTGIPPGRPAEWDASTYHRISNPHVVWGQPIIDRLHLTGSETVIDAGCGTGRLTAQVLERLPAGRVIAVDRDAAMLATAKAELEPRFGDRVRVVRADLLDLDSAVDEPADRVFSTATFHWVGDHERLFGAIFRSLRPGGWLVAQCGGAGNIQRVIGHAAEIAREPDFQPWFAGWAGPWTFSDDRQAARRLAKAGFTEIETALIEAPVTQPDSAAFAQFARSVVFGEHLARLPTDGLRDRFVAAITERAGRDDPPYTLDYRRLNIRAQRPFSPGTEGPVRWGDDGVRRLA